MSLSSKSKDLLHLYKKLLRSAAKYPSKNRWGIYQAIREEFRESVNLDPKAANTQKKIQVAFKGLSQLNQYSETSLSRGDSDSPNWVVHLEQNPMPKPNQ